MSEHYFTASPVVEAEERTHRFSIRGVERTVVTASGVFSADRLDKGTQVLLDHVPDPAQTGTFLDLGCGWGPITLALADAVVITDVYPARETQADFPDITGDTVAQRVPGGTARFVAERLEAAHAVADLARPGDLLLTVGAGDVTELAGTVLGDLAAREGGAAPSPSDRDEQA